MGTLSNPTGWAIQRFCGIFSSRYVDNEHFNVTILHMNVFNENIMRYLLIIAALMLAPSLHAADVPAQFIVLESETGFESGRRYAGQTVAARSSELGFKQTGLVTEILVDIGSKVRAGQKLAQLDSASLSARLAAADAEISVARAALTASEAQVRLARNTERRLYKLREAGHTPQQVYDEARLNLEVRAADRLVAKAQLDRNLASRRMAQIALDEAALYAPFDGVIQARYVDEGAQIVPGQATLRIVENQQIEVHVGVPTQVASTLGDYENLILKWQNQTLPATLKSVLPEVDRTTRTQTAVLVTRANELPLGSVVELHLSQKVASPGFWVPLSALIESERGLWGAYVIAADDTVERRLVEIVHSDGDAVFVRGTLTAGERLVSGGVHRMVPGQQVKPTKSVAIAHAR